MLASAASRLLTLSCLRIRIGLRRRGVLRDLLNRGRLHRSRRLNLRLRYGLGC
jgi:hypothetical protein